MYLTFLNSKKAFDFRGVLRSKIDAHLSVCSMLNLFFLSENNFKKLMSGETGTLGKRYNSIY